jgi:hypothetical protein
VQIPGQALAYLIAGGRTTGKDGTATAKSFVLTLSVDGASKLQNTATIQEVGAAGTNGAAMSQSRVIGWRNLKRCGDSKLIAFGGITEDGFQIFTATAATTSVEVFTYNAGNNGGDSTWAPLKDASNNTVTLNTARGYHEVLAPSTSTFYVYGGMNAGAVALKTGEKLTVNSSCVSQNDGTANKLEALSTGSDMPGERARFGSAAVATDTFGGKNYEFVVASGNNTTSAPPASATTDHPRDAYLFDTGTETWATITNALQEGKLFARSLRTPGAASVKFVTGIKVDPSNQANMRANPYYNTSITVDVIADGAHAFTTGTALSTSRYGAAVDSLKNGAGAFTDYLGFGATHANTAGTTPNPSSMPADFVTF